MKDVLIIGSGAAGLIAAKHLSEQGKKVIVVEARNRIGGRMHTIQANTLEQTLEAGAEFIHGNLPLTLELLKEGKIAHQKTGGKFLHHKGKKFVQETMFEHFEDLHKALKKVKEDIPVSQFLETYLTEKKYDKLKKSVANYVQSYYAAELNRASTLAMKEELEGADEEQYRVHGGYKKLYDHLYAACIKNGCTFHLNTIITKVIWEEDEIQLQTNEDEIFEAKKVLITVPLGVLQDSESGALQFEPAINSKKEALNQLGSGPVIKILLHFHDAFWQKDGDLKEAGFIFSEEEIPTWWTQYPHPSGVLVGWCAGPNTKGLSHLKDEEIFAKSITSLSRILNKTEKDLSDKLLSWHVYNWLADPYAKGGYAYTTVQSKKAVEEIEKAEKETLFFAGEAIYTGIEIGTVEAALQSGLKAAKHIAKRLK